MVISHQGFPTLNAISAKTIQIEKGGMPHLNQLFILSYPFFNIENLPQHVKSAITNA